MAGLSSTTRTSCSATFTIAGPGLARHRDYPPETPSRTRPTATGFTTLVKPRLTEPLTLASSLAQPPSASRLAHLRPPCSTSTRAQLQAAAARHLNPRAACLEADI